ncbi:MULTISPECIES: glycosyltransferase family 2 protein [unclassified Streptomyces]|uniref:glycosyltransferase family 2 protein n=1 Tax=unclassified Streptomyces TaxID=2593676 RepID=UPI0035DFB69B
MRALMAGPRFAVTTLVVIDFEGLTPAGRPAEPIEVAAPALHPVAGRLVEVGRFEEPMRPPADVPVTARDVRLKGITPQMLSATCPAAEQATLLAQNGVDVRVVVVGNGCRPEVVPPGTLTVCLPKNIGIPGGRNAGADALRDAVDPADWLYFLDNDATFPRPDALAQLVAEAERHPEAAWVQPRLTGPDDVTTPRRWVPRLRASNPGRPGRVTSMTEGVVLIRRDAFDAVGGWESRMFLYHEGSDLARRLYEAGWSRWYAASIRMHHPLTAPGRHALHHRLAARNRIWIAHRNLPAPLLPLYPSVWTAITLARPCAGVVWARLCAACAKGGRRGVRSRAVR